MLAVRSYVFSSLPLWMAFVVKDSASLLPTHFCLMRRLLFQTRKELLYLWVAFINFVQKFSWMLWCYCVYEYCRMCSYYVLWRRVVLLTCSFKRTVTASLYWLPICVKVDGLLYVSGLVCHLYTNVALCNEPIIQSILQVKLGHPKASKGERAFRDCWSGILLSGGCCSCCHCQST